MAITATTFPEKVSLANRQPVQVSLTSNLPLSAVSYNSLLLVVAGVSDPGQVIAFSYGDFSIQLTFSEQGGSEPLTLSLRNGLSTEDYTNLLAQQLEAQVQILLNFEVYVDQTVTGPRIRLLPRGNANLVFTHFTDAAIGISTSTAGSSEFFGTPGLTLVNEIYDAAAGLFSQRIQHQLPVLATNEAVIIDLQDDFDLNYEAPRPSSIGPGANYVHACTRNWAKYRIKYAETTGRPPIAGPLIAHEEELFVVHGSRGFQTQFSAFWSFWESNGRFQTRLLSPQRVAPQQPNWLYWLGREDSRLVQINALITHESGATEDRLLGFFTERLGEVVALSCGMRQLGISETDPDMVVRYDFYLSTLGRGEDISNRFGFMVTYDCEDWERYLLVGNSLGGMDTLRTTGRFQITSEATTNAGRRYVTAADIADGIGEDFHYGRQHRLMYSGSVGHVNRQDIVRLQSLLLSTEVKLIDTEKQRFVPILIDAGSVALTKDGNDLESITFSFRLAYEDHSLDDAPKLI